MSPQIGHDRALKTRLAAASPDARRILAAGVLRDCADIRVEHALTAAMEDPETTPTQRLWLLGVLREVGAAASV